MFFLLRTDVRTNPGSTRILSYVTNVDVGEEIHDNQKNEADSTQHEAGGHGEVGEHNEVGNHDETAPPVTTDENKWLALLAAETKGEIPGKAYGYLDENNGGQRDIPIVSHYIQKIDCGFVQEVLSDPKVRLQTFPPGEHNKTTWL